MLILRDVPVKQRQKSLEAMEPSPANLARNMRLPHSGSYGYQRLKDRSMSMPTRPASQASTITILTNVTNDETDSNFGGESPRVEEKDLPGARGGEPDEDGEDQDQDQLDQLLPHVENLVMGEVQEPRGSVSNENNILLDPDVLTDHVTQVRINF